MSNGVQSGRSTYLIKNGAVITVDPKLGTLPKADVLVRDGAIVRVGADLDADGAEIIDATDMIVMPGLIDSHYHMWSALGRNFISDDGFEYFPAKWATSELYDADDFYNSVILGLAELASGGVTTVHNWSHNNRSPKHVDAELRAHRESGLSVAMTLHPNAFPSWIAVVPMPPAPPWTSSVSPAFRPTPMNRLLQTVKKVSGSPAASRTETP